MTPSPFAVAREIGTNLAGAYQQAKDQNAIEQILSNAMRSKDPQVLQDSIGSILSQVSKENQKPAIEYLNSIYDRIQGEEAARKGGYIYGEPAAVSAARIKEQGKAQRYSQTYPELAGGVPSGGQQMQGLQPTQAQQLSGSAIEPMLEEQQQPEAQPPVKKKPPQIRTPSDILNNIRDLTEDQLVRYAGHPDRAISEAVKQEKIRRDSEKSIIAADKRAKDKEENTQKRAMRQETLPLRMEYIDRANIAREGIRNKTHLMGIIDRGNLNDPTYAIFAESLPFNLGQRMLSADTVEYKGGLIDEYGDLKNIFKGATRVKEVELYEKKIADIYYTDSQKKAILKSRIDAQKVDLIREEAAAEVEEKYPNISALQFNKKVEEIAQPRIDALFNQIWNQQKAVTDQAEARKKVPLDLNDPEDLQIIDQILKENGGDWVKAEKEAKRKGYTF